LPFYPPIVKNVSAKLSTSIVDNCTCVAYVDDALDWVKNTLVSGVGPVGPVGPITFEAGPVGPVGPVAPPPPDCKGRPLKVTVFVEVSTI
jgi:hypothetical protein